MRQVSWLTAFLLPSSGVYRNGDALQFSFADHSCTTAHDFNMVPLLQTGFPATDILVFVRTDFKII